jgi:hypothetical protein
MVRWYKFQRYGANSLRCYEVEETEYKDNVESYPLAWKEGSEDTYFLKNLKGDPEEREIKGDPMPMLPALTYCADTYWYCYFSASDCNLDDTKKGWSEMLANNENGNIASNEYCLQS